jgi:hypothetical protein
MVMLGKRMWKAILSPNWALARRRGSANISAAWDMAKFTSYF